MADKSDPLYDRHPRCMSIPDEDKVAEENYGRNIFSNHTSQQLNNIKQELSYFSKRRERGQSCTEAMRRSTEVASWDMFALMPESTAESNGGGFVDKCLQLIKLSAYLITFIIVLMGAVISKSTLLFMTSQIGLGMKKNLTLCGAEGYIQELPTSEIVAWVWALFGSLSLPEILPFLKCLKKVLFKSKTSPKALFICLALLFETFHSLGMVVLVFLILPYRDALKGALLLQGVCIVPGFLNMLTRSTKESIFGLKLIMDFLSFFGQLSILLLLFIDINYWSAIVALILVSFAWWENYVAKESSFHFIRVLGELKVELKKTRYKLYCFLCPYKVLLTLGLILAMLKYKGLPLDIMFNSDIYKIHNITVKWSKYDIRIISTSNFYTPCFVMMIQYFSGVLCFFAAKFACRIQIQPFSFAFPLTLVTPLLILLLLYSCAIKHETKCFLQNIIPDYLFWNCRNQGYTGDWFLHKDYWILYIAIIWLLSQTWITRHTWISSDKKLEDTANLFVLPYYNGLLLDQSLALNRRRIREKKILSEIQIPEDNTYDNLNKEDLKERYSGGAILNKVTKEESVKIDIENSECKKGFEDIIKIYACATMWHETADEMLQMLKSIMRMDQDQCTRRLAQSHMKIMDPDYYEFETHIFFDDAFEISDKCDDWTQVNKFVLLLINTIAEAATQLHQIKIKRLKMKKMPTPYGGRLEWELPGKTKLIAHLKDKSKIRHRKRWSQVMYMYYLLGFELLGMNCSPEAKSIKARNTFILALDGDIDFKPKAVALLIDLMRKNPTVGSACGRIHPIGPGPMVWFQKFEYSIGHWLQKAAEHVMGCVLCSPGCFSIFRAQALMDENVMAKYTTVSSEALHYVQFDQGEDRWLCTLILQQGYRIEYCAASDAFTHAPEGFDEFFNQRRRWVPSTMANIMDLLTNFKRTVSINNSLSTFYILYQGIMMGGTIIGPGTIFLMITSALNSVFPTVTVWQAFWINFTIVLIFAISCFFGSRKIQLLLAQFFTTTYCFMMMAVFVGTVLQFNSEFGSPPTLFTTILFGIFFFAAFIHPQEMLSVVTIVPLLLYWLLIPSMYLLLNIYSLVNMNDVTWGTREGVTKKTKAEIEKEKQEEEELKKKAKSTNAVFDFLKNTLNSGNPKEDNGMSFGFGNICRCLLCWAPSDDTVKQELFRITQSLEHIKTDINKLNKKGFRALSRKISAISEQPAKEGTPLKSIINNKDEEDPLAPSDDEIDNTPKDSFPERDMLTNPYWIEHPDLKYCSQESLDETELTFWKEFIKKYLRPIDENKAKQAEIAADLLVLRNKVAFGFFILNGLFIILIFMLQISAELRICMDDFIDISMSKNNTYCKDNQYELEPIGLTFVILFAFILLFQFIGMIIHRYDTLCHLLASTKITMFSRKKEDDDDTMTEINVISVARTFGDLKSANKMDSITSKTAVPSQNSLESVDQMLVRDPIRKMYKSQRAPQRIQSIDKAFKKNRHNFSSGNEKTRESILQNFKSTRRDTINLFLRQTWKIKESAVDNGNVITHNDSDTEVQTNISFRPKRQELSVRSASRSIKIPLENETDQL